MDRMMARLMADPQARAALRDRTGIDLDNFGKASTPEQLRRQFRERRECLLRGRHGMEGLVTTDYGSRNAKPPGASKQTLIPPETLLPVRIANLLVNTTHKGRILRGTLVEKPCLMHSVQCLLEDEAGDIVMVSIYNWPGLDSESSRAAQWAAVDHHFKPGAFLAVIEPYFKVMADGTHGVRVDSPESDVIWLESLGPSDAAGWQEQGKEHFRKKQYREATSCFDRALSLVAQAEDAILMKLVLNASQCCLKLGQPGPASQWAAVVAAVLPSPPGGLGAKAWYRLAEALSQLEHHGCADIALGRAVELNPALGNKKASTTKSSPEALLCGADRALPLSQVLFKVFSSSPLHSRGSGSSSTCGSGGSATSGDCPAALKQLGNELFGSGDSSGALRAYLGGIQKCCTTGGVAASLAVLMSNRAQCSLNRGNFEGAVTDAGVAVILAPGNAKSHYRRALGLLNLHSLPEAEAACREGLEVADLESSGLSQLLSRISSAQSPAALSSRVHQQQAESSRETLERTQEIGEQSKEGAMGPGQISAFADMMELLGSAMGTDMRRDLPKSLAELMTVDKRVPELHNEFSREGLWPPECDAKAGYQLLWNAYEHARTISMVRMRLVGEHIQAEDIMKRLGRGDRATLNWWANARFGECRLIEANRPSYGQGMMIGKDGHMVLSSERKFVCHSFGNSPGRREILHTGTTHVAVGFNDLGTLMYADLVPGPLSSEKPLRWVGFDISPYVCAKTAVVVRMMMQAAQVDEILQVWFSSSWSNATCSAFRRALAALMKEQQPGAPYLSSKVMAILNLWQIRDIALAEARRQVQEGLLNAGGTHYELANWRIKADRLAMCRYLLTRELLSGDVGSVVMFAIPQDGKLARPPVEHFLYTMPHKELMEARGRRDVANIVDAGVEVLREKIGKLRRALLEGRVEVELHHEAVEPAMMMGVPPDDGSREDVHRLIASLTPYSMSWSNVLDYAEPSAFHRMARACSAPSGTVHYGYSMNWPQYTYGASVLDYVDDQEKVDELVEMGRKAVAQMSRVTGVRGLLLDPPVENAMNLGDYACFIGTHNLWAKAFFGTAGLRDLERQVPVVELKPYTVWAQANSTVSLVWTYDSDLQFRAVQKP